MNFLIKRKVHIALGLCAVAVIVAALAISVSRKTYVVLPSKESVSLPSINQFDNLNLEAKAVYVVDLSNGKTLFSKNATTTLPLASLTKLVSILVAAKHLPSEASIPITEGDSNGLDPGETWSFDKLVDFTLVTSSNDGIDAIASVAGGVISTTTESAQDAFVDSMNQTVTSLGLSDMHFFNPSGLDLDSTTSGGYGSAKDIATVISYLLKNYPDLLSATPDETVRISSNLVNHVAENTDQALPDIPAVIVSKTGNTDLAGGNLAVMFDAGLMHPVAIVLLSSSFYGQIHRYGSFGQSDRRDALRKKYLMLRICYNKRQ